MSSIREVIKGHILNNPDLDKTTLKNQCYSLLPNELPQSIDRAFRFCWNQIKEVLEELNYRKDDDFYYFSVGNTNYKIPIVVVDQIVTYVNNNPKSYRVTTITEFTGYPDYVCKFIIHNIKEICDASSHKTGALSIYDAKQKQLNALIEKYTKRNSKNDYIDDYIEGLVDTLGLNTKHTVINRLDTDVNSNVDELVLVITDLHIGAKYDGDSLNHKYNIEICAHRLEQIAQTVNSKKAKKVHVKILGDIIESVTGLNHNSTFHNMEAEVLLENSIIKGYEILMGFLNSVNNLASIDCISGNHGRFTSDKGTDPYGSAEKVIYYFIKNNFLKHGIPTNISHTYIVSKHSNINYISTHGDKELIRSPKDVIINYSGGAEYTVVLIGHRHIFNCSVDTTKYRVVNCPAVFSGTDWHVQTGINTNPGFIIFSKEENYKTPSMQVYNFNE